MSQGYSHLSIAEDIQTAIRIAPYFTWNKFSRNLTKYLTIPQIYELSKRFSAAVGALNWFTIEMQRKARPEGPHARPMKEPELIVRIRGLIALRKQEQPSQPQP
jgi:hypothetical protein